MKRKSAQEGLAILERLEAKYLQNKTLKKKAAVFNRFDDHGGGLT
ncbi:hypothetical protein [Alteromonas macleodii]|nr:hypothetical protein [Alteromonas macleodii]